MNLALQHAENAAFCNKSDTWVTPGIPYMIFITAGFVIRAGVRGFYNERLWGFSLGTENSR
ncbi:A24 family peptidase C-terminal domain-containing protein [Candidatus Nitrosotenuis chungbukensis]|nr:A24 family peptidase C-terminal domain-containing protein [Candidatus Nitrosotenuis chungbukensis]